MATLLFTAVGTAVGGPLGGLVGAVVGSQVDSALIGNGSISGPRLKELDVTTSSYGSALPRHFGRMRVPGTVIWSTELQEDSETDGGKNQPDVTTYSYTVSFAVALGSRPILDIGRIWADGILLRGSAGDLKVGGTMRLYTGEADQMADPLLSGAELASRTPAFRGLAYVVFEDLELSEFYNRLPALTFEVIVEDDISLNDIVGEVIDETSAQVPLAGLAGFSSEGPIVDALRQLDPVYQLDTDASAEQLTISRSLLQQTPIALPEPAVAVGDDEFGGPSGFARRRLPISERPPEIVRYYDIDRDYQPGLQRAVGRVGPGQPTTLELPAAMSSTNARLLIEGVRQRTDWSRDRIVWRSAELDPAIGPGSVVSLPSKPGLWRVDEWEWRETGVELALKRVVPSGADAAPGSPTDSGQFNPPTDLEAPPTSLVAFELPWDGAGSGDAPALFAAASSSDANWSGAALFADLGDGELQSLGPSGRTRSILGVSVDALPEANPLTLDRASTVEVELVSEDFNLVDSTSRQLAMGANRALLGSEIIQFGRAEPLGNARWRLSALLRGRGGTEAAVTGHAPDETFVLLDSKPVAIDPNIVSTSTDAAIVAVGRGDDDPVDSSIALRGITLRPLAPVHPGVRNFADTSLELSWTRRARGAWLWLDEVGTPLHEQSEAYLIEYGTPGSPIAAWTTSVPSLAISATTHADLVAALPNGEFHVRQQGSYALSAPLFLTTLT